MIENQYMDELIKKMAELNFVCEGLVAENKALHDENRMLVDYITKIGVKIKTELCTNYDYEAMRPVQFKRMDLDRATFYVESPHVERTNEFLSMLKNGEALPPFRFNSYRKLLSLDLSDYSDAEMFEYKCRKEEGEL